MPFIKAYFLDGTAPSIYYMCYPDASSITTANLSENPTFSKLPDTSNKYETYRYKNVLSGGFTGDAVSMRSKIKNVGAIQVGLVKLYDGSNIANPEDFAIEEISITFRQKSAR